MQFKYISDLDTTDFGLGIHNALLMKALLRMKLRRSSLRFTLRFKRRLVKAAGVEPRKWQ